jgi:hypothetical protein
MLTFNSSAVNSSVSFSIDWATAPLSGTNPAPRPVASAIVLAVDEQVKLDAAKVIADCADFNKVGQMATAKVTDRDMKAILQSDFAFLGDDLRYRASGASTSVTRTLKNIVNAKLKAEIGLSPDVLFINRGSVLNRYSPDIQAVVITAIGKMIRSQFKARFTPSGWCERAEYSTWLGASFEEGAKMQQIFAVLVRSLDAASPIRAFYSVETGIVHDRLRLTSLLLARLDARTAI